MPDHPSHSAPSRGEAEYIAAYDATLTLWAAPYESLWVHNNWGCTHVIACGPQDAPPLVLLHGMYLSSTMWFANAVELSRDRRIYAVDTIGSAGKSVAMRPLRSRDDLADWLDGVLDGLSIARTDLLGHSHGGWLALNYALRVPGRVKRLVLLAPAGSLLPLVRQFWVRGIPAALLPTRRLIASFMRWMTAEGFVVDELFVEQFVLGLRHFRPQIRVLPSVYTDDELRRIGARTLLLIGEDEVIYDPQAATDRARHLVPHIEAELVPNASHGLPMERPELVNERVLRFLGQ